MGTDLLDGDVELTEFIELDVQSIKGVKQGANGFPVLLMKGLAAKGARDCPKCDKSYDADHTGDNCENCGTKLPAPPASKASDSGDPGDAKDCPTCKGDGKIKGNTTGCPDCDGTGKAKAKKSTPAWYPAVRQVVEVLGMMKPPFPPQSAWSLVKAVAADGSIDEQPDIDGGKQIIAMIAKLISYEADELATGQLGEIGDISLLCSAADYVKWWMSHEVAAEMTLTVEEIDVVMNSLAVAKAKMSGNAVNDLPDSAFAYIEPGGTKDESGKTTPRSKRHFPVHDKAHADNAAARIAQGAEFGDKAKGKVEAAQRKFGEKDTSKSVPEGGTGVHTDPEDTGSLSKAVEDALTKALEPLRQELSKELGDLRALKAKVEAAPVPGGPLLSTVRATQRTEGGEDHVAKAAYYRQMADTVTDRQSADGYRQLAREADEKAAKARTQAPAAPAG